MSFSVIRPKRIDNKTLSALGELMKIAEREVTKMLNDKIVNLADYKQVFSDRSNVVPFRKLDTNSNVQTYTATGKPIVKVALKHNIGIKVKELPPRAA
jgi:hypothetical protein